MFGLLNEFIYGALWFAAIVALVYNGRRAITTGHFQAVAESYRGKTAQNLGVACLVVAIIVGLFFLRTVLGYVTTFLVLRELNIEPIFFLIGAGVGGYFTLRYYRTN